ncbi:sensor histidine kinase [Actinomyces ruminicola]|uniref:histidine kinase n=1 Tax=Actinomyces ruminicola TaxID=332524 RepID=A0A1G9SYN1_9ACTO|nr:histidine kinase [Actinomyces ruminicola]SDM40534.1 Signal transduction histidine kinase [Actinomyces ruminicola]
MTNVRGVVGSTGRVGIVHNRGVRELTDRAVVLGSCVVLVLASGMPTPTTIVWFLVAVTCSGTCAAWGRWPAVGALPAAYLLAGCADRAAIVGVPLAVYELVGAVSDRGRWVWVGAAICVAPLALALRRGPDTVVSVAAVLAAVAALLAVRSGQVDRAHSALHAVRDDLQHRVTVLQERQTRLEEAQDHETRAAALAERTRIAREIHDGVGHLLTRLLFQVHAAQVAHRGAPEVEAELRQIAQTADEALSAMRAGVHALDDTGEDLGVALNRLATGCGINQTKVDCASAVSPPAPVTRCLVAVAREALTNAARHGKARTAWVTVADFPGFWRLTVANDGTVPAWAESPQRLHSAQPGADGLGLGTRSMTDRVESLGGTLRILTRPRFTMLATIPKETT